MEIKEGLVEVNIGDEKRAEIETFLLGAGEISDEEAQERILAMLGKDRPRLGPKIWYSYCSYHGPIASGTTYSRMVSLNKEHEEGTAGPHAIREFMDEV